LICDHLSLLAAQYLSPILLGQFYEKHTCIQPADFWFDLRPILLGF
jgi:hypothetical protein